MNPSPCPLPGTERGFSPLSSQERGRGEVNPEILRRLVQISCAEPDFRLNVSLK